MGTFETNVADWVGEAIAAHQAGRSLALLFDYDGTLTPIVAHPSLSRLSEQNRHRLAALRDQPSLTLGVISGRSLNEVRELIGLPGLFYAGSGGLELDLFGETVTYPGAGTFRESLSELEDALVRVVACYPGAWIERKPVTWSMHFRGVSPLRSLAFQREVSSLLMARPAIQHRVVSQAIELAPASGWDKGTAVAALLAWMGRDALPIYAGDAANDTEAMAVATCLGGVALGVGSDAPSLATHRLASPEELGIALDSLLAGLARPREVPSAAQVACTDSPPAVPAPTSGAQDLLIVDADSENRSQTVTELRSEGWCVWEAATVEEALDTIHRHNRIKVVLVDLQMPGLQGCRALRELAAANPSLIRCATTARVSSQAEDAFRNLCDTPLFLRPFGGKGVSATLTRLLAGGEASRVP